MAKQEFLSGGTIESSLGKLGPMHAKKSQGIAADIDALSESIKHYSWTALSEMRGDPLVLKRIEEAERVLRELRKALSR